MRRKSRKSVKEGQRARAGFIKKVNTDAENADIIREMRFKKGFSLKKLSEISRISIQRLREIEGGKAVDRSQVKRLMLVIEGCD